MHFDRRQIEKDVKSCYDSGNAIALKVKGFDKTWSTGILEIIGENVFLKGSLYGGALPQDQIKLEDIEASKCYNVSFDSPVYQNIRDIRSAINNIRREFKKK